MKLHPACRLFPALDAKSLQALADDIAANGLEQPITLLDGMILDGRNRFNACKMAGVKPKFVKFAGKSTPVEWVVSQNLLRRHLTASQRAVVEFDLLPMLEREAKERQRLSKGRGKKVGKKVPTHSGGKATEVAARITKTNSKYVAIVKNLSKESPELVKQMRSGAITLQDATRQLRIDTETARAKKNTRRRRAAAGKNEIDSVLHGDCLDLLPTLANGSVSLCLTSPPYAEQRKQHYKSVSPEQYPAWTVRWMSLLRPKLAEDGSVLIVIRPHIHRGAISDYVLRTRLALRDDGWNEAEMLIWIKSDAPPLGSTRRPRRIWESILWFSKVANPYVNLKACGRDSKRIGFEPSFRFGLGGKSPLGAGQTLKIKNGIARVPAVFVAPVGTIEKQCAHPAMFPECLATQLIKTPNYRPRC